MTGPHSIGPIGAARLAQKQLTLAAGEEECSVCLDKLSAPRYGGRLVRFYCQHTLHRDCAESWYSSALKSGLCPSCPSCRKPCRYSLCDLYCVTIGE